MEVKFNADHDRPDDCQILVAITGSPEGILRKLEQMVMEMKGAYGKPIQGQVASWDSYSHVITPIWKGKEY